MITKENLKQQIESFPEQFSIDDLVERLILIEKIEKGEQQSSENKVIGHNSLDKELQKWFK